jgi:hypothetical protein
MEFYYSFVINVRVAKEEQCLNFNKLQTCQGCKKAGAWDYFEGLKDPDPFFEFTVRLILSQE